MRALGALLALAALVGGCTVQLHAPSQATLDDHTRRLGAVEARAAGLDEGVTQAVRALDARLRALEKGAPGG